jgi:hypothetical protein
MKRSAKYCIALAFIIAHVVTVLSQKLVIKMKDSTELTVRVLASSMKEIHADNSQDILIFDMARVTFPNYIPKRDDGLIKKFRWSGVKIIALGAPDSLLTGQIEPPPPSTYGPNSFLNFTTDGTTITWSNRFPQKESLLEAAYNCGNISNIKELNGKIYADLNNVMTKNGADIFGGRLILIPDSSGYKAQVKNFTMKMGYDRTVMLAVLTGVQKSNESLSFDGMIIKNGQLKQNSAAQKYLSSLDAKLTQILSFK